VRTGTVRASTLRQMESLNMDRAAPGLIRIYKQESTLEVWKQDRSGKFALLNSYPICKFSGNLGPKLMQGDHQAPEGFYDITPDQMNPNSSEYLAFNTGFPNAFDRSLGRTGSFLMVHGGCRSVGCYAMTDYAMEEIYGLVDEAFKGGQEKVQLEAFPFRMTAENLARHAILICHFGRCLRRAVMRSWRRSDHRESPFAIGDTSSILSLLAISTQAPRARLASIQRLLLARNSHLKQRQRA
jgi:murein L,D-transpeptidase YafK